MACKILLSDILFFFLFVARWFCNMFSRYSTSCFFCLLLDFEASDFCCYDFDIGKSYCSQRILTFFAKIIVVNNFWRFAKVTVISNFRRFARNTVVRNFSLIWFLLSDIISMVYCSLIVETRKTRQHMSWPLTWRSRVVDSWCDLLRTQSCSLIECLCRQDLFYCQGFSSLRLL